MVGQPIQMRQVLLGRIFLARHIENDFCGGKLGFNVDRLELVGSVWLGLWLVRSLVLALRIRVSVGVSGSGYKPGLPLQ